LRPHNIVVIVVRTSRIAPDANCETLSLARLRGIYPMWNLEEEKVGLVSIRGEAVKESKRQ